MTAVSPAHHAATPSAHPHAENRQVESAGQNFTALLLTGQQLISLINYLVQAGETSDAGAFVRELAQRVLQPEDELMTIAQQLEQKGIQKGIEQGRMEGIQLGEQRGIEKGRYEGKLEGKLEVARTMLQNGLDRNTVMKLTGLTEDDLAQICH